jgi:ribosomal protein L37AE/L43A
MLYRWLGIEQGPGCPRCSARTWLKKVIENQDVWRCDLCWHEHTTAPDKR